MLFLKLYDFGIWMRLDVLVVKKQTRSLLPKQVGALVSAKLGQLVTLYYAVSALENSLSPMVIFPKVNFKDHFIMCAYIGSIGCVYTTGWMTGAHFCLFMAHFVKHTRA